MYERRGHFNAMITSTGKLLDVTVIRANRPITGWYSELKEVIGRMEHLRKVLVDIILTFAGCHVQFRFRSWQKVVAAS